MLKGMNLKVLSCVLMCAFVTLITSAVYAVDTEILITEDNYLIYLSGVDEVFEYYVEPAGDSVEDPASYTNISSLDSANNNIAVLSKNRVGNIDALDFWYRLKNGSGTKTTLDFTKAVTEGDVKIAATITNVIDIEPSDSIVTTEIINGESTEVTRGTFKIVDADLDNYTYKYYISKVLTDDLVALRDIAANSVNLNSTFEILRYTRQLKEAISKNVPNTEEVNFSQTEDGIIEQPQVSKDKEEIVIWLVKEKDGEVEETDLQFVTCTRVEKGKKGMVTVTLPKTNDNIILFVVLAVNVCLLVFVLIRRSKLKENK